MWHLRDFKFFDRIVFLRCRSYISKSNSFCKNQNFIALCTRFGWFLSSVRFDSFKLFGLSKEIIRFMYACEYMFRHWFCVLFFVTPIRIFISSVFRICSVYSSVIAHHSTLRCTRYIEAVSFQHHTPQFTMHLALVVAVFVFAIAMPITGFGW